MGPSKTVNPSPFDNFRTTLQFLMSITSVKAMFDVQTYVLLPGCTMSEPCFDLMVNHPMAPSDTAFALARMALPVTSVRGPSMSSTTSKAFSLRISLLSEPNVSCNETSVVAYRHGFGIDCKNSVPWFPVAVTQPTIPSLKARARTRMTPRPSSLFGPSNASTSSPTSNFRCVVLVLMSNSPVIAISFTHLKYLSMSARKPRREMLPASTPLILDSARLFCCAVSTRSGRPSTCLKNASSDICSLPPASSEKRTSAWMSRARSDARIAEATIPILSSPMTSHASLIVLTTSADLFSVTCTRPLSFFMSCLASNHGPFVALPTFTSWAWRQVRASWMLVCTAPAAASTASRTATGSATWLMLAPLVSGPAASSKVFSPVSADSTFSVMALRITEAALRSFFSSIFVFSSSSRLVCSLLPSSIRFFNVSNLACKTLTFGLHFANSSLASANGPFSHKLSSLLLALM
mmetsp:Transcript_41316/g.124689  ORF Transcript_41316/g.124689 Transcript_41316/m.124689 type:complete len:464 (+) Transcript_41316:632-2023(+)